MSYRTFPSHISQLPYRLKNFIRIKISLTATFINLSWAYRVLFDFYKSFNDSLKYLKFQSANFNICNLQILKSVNLTIMSRVLKQIPFIFLYCRICVLD